MIIRIAWRNIRRNARRSTATIFALSIGTLAILLFGGFVFSIYYGIQTTLYSEQGHIHIYSNGYMAYGAVEPERYTINNYSTVIKRIKADPQLAGKLQIVTPQTLISGIAGVVATDNSKLFSGIGVIPEDLATMLQWDAWDLQTNGSASSLLTLDKNSALLGFGMARMLGLCQQLRLADCIDPPQPIEPQVLTHTQSEDMIAPEFSFEDLPYSHSATNKQDVSINILAATTSGVPNIETVSIQGVRPQGARSVDNMYMLMHFDLAQSLLFGQEEKATRVVVQIKDPEDIQFVKGRITRLLQSSMTAGEFEVFTMTEVDPTFSNILKMFSFIFGVVSIFLGVVIIATISNTINMTVMERIGETGTIRAMGFQQNFICRMFLTESVMLGVLGLMVGLLGATALTSLINVLHVTWTPPSNATPIPIQLLLFENPLLPLGVIAFIIALSALAGIIPAKRASRMNIVDALNHV